MMVKTRAGDGISSDESYLLYWIKGVITTEGESPDIGSAGYRIEQAAFMKNQTLSIIYLDGSSKTVVVVFKIIGELVPAIVFADSFFI